MARTKRYYYDRVILGIQDSPGFNIDWKVQPREVFLIVDDIVNSLAKQNFLDNWKVSGDGVDEQFVTEWSGSSGITVVDPTDQPSYLTLPANYAALPNLAGIREIWPENYEYGFVKIVPHEDIRRTRNLMSGNFQGELAGYPRGNLFVFNQVNVGKNFSTTFGVRLVIKDSTMITETEPYPVPADLEEEIIRRAIEFVLKKRLSPTDLIRDRNDALTRN